MVKSLLLKLFSVLLVLVQEGERHLSEDHVLLLNAFGDGLAVKIW